MSLYSIPSDFAWDSDYEALLEQIALTDVVDSEWTKLRDIIKFKIQQNIQAYLAKPTPAPPAISGLLRDPKPDATGSLKLPPFPPRKGNALTLPEIPPNYMTAKQAEEMKDNIFEQLHTFDANPPFTIQRVCELAIDPTKHYSSVGKYLRAVEKSVLVTSTCDAFPPLTEKEKEPYLSALVGVSTTPSTPSSTPPSTPLFSPIPFLHEDARRSKSRSPPPPSPLSLAATAGTNEVPSLGLVDELDDPSGPQHMSDHPTALTSTTTSDSSPTKGKPFLGTLQQRFVPASGETSTDPQAGDDDMDLDDAEAEDKENRAEGQPRGRA